MQTRALDWNVVATIYEGEFAVAMRLLRPFGRVWSTDYRNVLLIAVDNIPEFLDELAAQTLADASIANSVSRIIPVTHKFRFQSPDEFEEKACRVVDEWVEEIKGRSFHVRMHRRGFKGRLLSQHEEQFLDHHLLECTEREGSKARIDFDDPDLTVAVETIGQSAGLSRWTRAQREAFDFLRLD